MSSSVGLDARLSRALSHPLRQRILVALGGRVASPSDLADELGARLGDVSYHTKQLHACECLELVRTERRRGAIKHFYTATRRLEVEDEQWLSFSPGERRRLAEGVLADVVLDASRASREGRMEVEGVHISRTLLELDPEGQEAVRLLLRDVIERVLALQAESVARRAASGGAAEAEATAASELAILHFPT